MSAAPARRSVYVFSETQLKVLHGVIDTVLDVVLDEKIFDAKLEAQVNRCISESKLDASAACNNVTSSDIEELLKFDNIPTPVRNAWVLLRHAKEAKTDPSPQTLQVLLDANPNFNLLKIAQIKLFTADLKEQKAEWSAALCSSLLNLRRAYLEMTPPMEYAYQERHSFRFFIGLAPFQLDKLNGQQLVAGVIQAEVARYVNERVSSFKNKAKQSEVKSETKVSAASDGDGGDRKESKEERKASESPSLLNWDMKNLKRIAFREIKTDENTRVEACVMLAHLYRERDAEWRLLEFDNRMELKHSPHSALTGIFSMHIMSPKNIERMRYFLNEAKKHSSKPGGKMANILLNESKAWQTMEGTREYFSQYSELLISKYLPASFNYFTSRIMPPSSMTLNEIMLLLIGISSAREAPERLVSAEAVPSIFPFLKDRLSNMLMSPEEMKPFFDAAYANYPPALHFMGMIYEYVPDNEYSKESNLRAAFDLYSSAAKQDYPASIISLAHCFELGIGTAKSIDRAVQLYSQAANDGSVYACGRLGRIYSVGTYVARSIAEVELAKWQKMEEDNLGELVDANASVNTFTL
ncbi:MAG: sel1 repeat family protein [Gammaproteobacteria bacterium]|nr:sel1 repeat family protein [Gammaproteobacteria bacterium]